MASRAQYALESILHITGQNHSAELKLGLILQTIALYMGTEAEMRTAREALQSRTTRERSRSRDRGRPLRASGVPPVAQLAGTPGRASGDPPMARPGGTPTTPAGPSDAQFRGVPATPGPEFSQVPQLPRGPDVRPRGPPPGTPWVAPGTPAPTGFHPLGGFGAPVRPAGPADAPPPGGYRNVFDDEAAP